MRYYKSAHLPDGSLVCVGCHISAHSPSFLGSYTDKYLVLSIHRSSTGMYLRCHALAFNDKPYLSFTVDIPVSLVLSVLSFPEPI